MINLRNFLHYLSFIALLIPIIFSCRPVYTPDPIFETYNDFERTIGWVQSEKNNSNTVVKEAGYKSNYGCKVDKGSPFGYIFNIGYSEISPEGAGSLRVTFMCKKISAAADSCTIVCSFEDADRKLLEWNASPLKEEINGSTDWVEIKKEFPLNAYRAPCRINIVVWNHNTSQAVYIDNMKLEFY